MRVRSFLVVLAGLVLCAAAFRVAAAPPDAPQLRLKAGVFDPLKATLDFPPTLRLDRAPEFGYFVVQFRVEIDPDVLDRVRSSGVEPIYYLPEQAYVVRVPPGRLHALRNLSEVRWVGAVQPGWKIAPDLGRRPYRDSSRREGGQLFATVDLFPGETIAAAISRAKDLGMTLLRTDVFSDTLRFRVRATRGQLERLARLPAVAWIEELAEITERNNTTSWVVQTNVSGSTTVWDSGLHGEGQIIGHIDGRIDMNSCFFMDSSDNTPGPGHRKVVAYRSSSGLGADTHGTHTAGTAAGRQVGSLDRAGLAYEAKLSHTNLGDITGSGTSTSNLYSFLEAAHLDGARMHTNSFGDDGTTAYTTWSRDIDSFSYDFEDGLVVFAETNGSTLRTPENAKNVLAVAASQNGGSADSHCSGGTGPTSDGRRKPEIYAPGCSISSARAGLSCDFTSLTGTSMAAPAITAGGALVRQYFEEGWYPSGTPQPLDALNPSGALVKAMLLNSSVDMTGIAGYPSNLEGWGRMLLENALFFSGDARKLVVLADRRNVDGLVTGEGMGYAVEVTDTAEALKVTLVFTEPPAALLASAATINDLDLEVVSPSGTLYRGNVFGGGVSTPGGGPDSINNVEMVLVPAPELGDWIVSVRGTAVNQGTQGFALVATGDVALSTSANLALVTRSFVEVSGLGNGDGIPDPGETIVVPHTLLNPRPTTATSVTTQLSTPGANPVQVTQSGADFPDIEANQFADSLVPHHQFTIAPSATCGASIPFDVQISDDQATTATAFDMQIGQGDLVVAASDTPVALPKFDATPSTSTIDIGTASTLDDVLVSVQIDHGDISELVVTLTSPTGTEVTLHDRTGSGVSGLDATYDSEVQPDGPGSMSDFDGQDAQGTWTLGVLDNTTGPISPGTLQSWSLVLSGPGFPIACNPLDCAGDPVPGEVPEDMMVGIEGGSDLRFDWTSVSGASSYRVWQSETASFDQQELVGSTASTTLVQSGAAVGPGITFYLVRAANSCEWEGP